MHTHWFFFFPLPNSLFILYAVISSNQSRATNSVQARLSESESVNIQKSSKIISTQKLHYSQRKGLYGGKCISNITCCYMCKSFVSWHNRCSLLKQPGAHSERGVDMCGVTLPPCGVNLSLLNQTDFFEVIQIYYSDSQNGESALFQRALSLFYNLVL